MANRNTKQKELILEVVKNNRIHPTIHEIYDLVQQQDSTIGQATVYRNIKKFVGEGKIYVVKTNQGMDRYDYFNDHIHFECCQCGKIIDWFDDSIFLYLREKFAKSPETIIDYKVTLEGICKNCQRSKDEEVSL